MERHVGVPPTPRRGKEIKMKNEKNIDRKVMWVYENMIIKRTVMMIALVMM